MGIWGKCCLYRVSELLGIHLTGWTYSLQMAWRYTSGNWELVMGNGESSTAREEPLRSR
ncbi:MAG: hypothetical protein KME31_35655 [Tolypothrix carrinoi HA7290-LM1]|nr:hypothetical protein [Tolypothrix carrinoi HA7290-LM1]